MRPVPAFHFPAVARAKAALIAVFVSLMIAPFGAHAGSISGRHVVDLGCQGVNCYVTFDGDAAPGLAGSSCAANSSEFRWDGTTAAGKLLYSSLLTAFVATKVVSVYYSSCYSGYGGTYLTIEYFHISG